MSKETPHLQAKKVVDEFDWEHLEDNYSHREEIKVSGYPTAQAYAQAMVDIAYVNGYVSSKAHKTIAASAIYSAASHFEYNVSQYEIAEMVGVSQVSIRKNYKDLLVMIDPNDSILLVESSTPLKDGNKELWD